MKRTKAINYYFANFAHINIVWNFYSIKTTVFQYDSLYSTIKTFDMQH